MKKVVNIFYDYQIFSQQSYGGISRYFVEMAKQIGCHDDFSVRIFSPLYINKYLGGTHSPTIGIAVPDLKKTAFIRNIVNKIFTDIGLKILAPNIIHETYYSKSSSRSSAKRVITVYDMIHEKFPESYPAQDKTREMKRHAVQRADHVICISENTRRDLIEFLGVPEEKTSVVYLGYTLNAKPDPSIPAVASMPYILYVGQRGGYKNFKALLRVYAASLLLKNEFNLICFGGGDFTHQELALIDSLNLGVAKVVQISGGDGVLAAMYNSAAVFVYPSLYEGFGIPPLEAMSHDCPVVCANTSSLPEVVGDAAEFFDPAEDSTMRAAIERVVSKPEHAAVLVAKGRKRIMQFSWEKCARDTVDVYKKILQG